MKTVSFIYNVYKKYPFDIVLNIGLIVLSTVISLGSIFSIGPIIDFLLNKDKESMSQLTRNIIGLMERFYNPISTKTLIIIFIGLMFVSAVFAVILRYFMLQLQYKVLKDVILGTFVKCFNATWYFFAERNIGKLINSFTREAEVVGSAFRTISELLSFSIQTVLYLTIPFYISWEITLICIIFAGIISVIYMQFGKVTYRLGQLNTATANRFISILQESLGSAKIILGFGNQKKTILKIDAAVEAHRKVTIRSQTISKSIPEFVVPMASIIIVTAFYYSESKSMPISDTTIMLIALVRVIPMIGRISSLKTVLDNFLPSYEQISEIRSDADKLVQLSGEAPYAGFERQIILKDVSFNYPGRPPTLMNINMRIPKGQMIAVVGTSGAGKSTLVDLIMGFNQPSSGSITIDDRSLHSFEIQSYRKKIGYVPQDSILFNSSIRDNLLWANDKASQEQIRHACFMSNALEFIQKLPDGFETIVGDRGVRLSGGQIQRIALARSILRAPDLLILDEATSALDTYSERQIQKALEKIARETTIIAVAHRLSTIVNADCIYIMDGGIIVEAGSYDHLVKSNGPFKKMVALQNLKIDPEAI